MQIGAGWGGGVPVVGRNRSCSSEACSATVWHFENKERLYTASRIAPFAVLLLDACARKFDIGGFTRSCAAVPLFICIDPV